MRQVPKSRIHAVSTKLLSLFPDPNRDDPTRNHANFDQPGNFMETPEKSMWRSNILSKKHPRFHRFSL
jgi:hypothetical protein